MASRHLSRIGVLQALFECDIKDSLSLENAAHILERNIQSAEHTDTDRAFAESLLRGVFEKKEELDAVIAKAAPQWPLSKIAPIDRNVLRIGLFELLFGDTSAVPPKVALNEAIELAKSFGGDSSGKFINGVLGTIYRDIGEPGKKDAPKSTEPIPHENLGGVFLVARESGRVSIALVRDAFGKWTLPKAKCGENELSDSAALRAMRDELGVSGALGAPLGEHEYTAHEPHTGKVVRTVGYFLAYVDKQELLTCEMREGITDAQWFSEEAIASLDTYSDLAPIFEAGITRAKEL